MDTPDSPKRRGLRFAPTLQLEQTLSLAAFMMSLAITLINAWYAMRGAEVAVDAPEQLILYRDGVGDNSVLTIAARVDLINVASGYGDVLQRATLALEDGSATLKQQATVRPVFLSESSLPPEDCEVGTRCMRLPGLLLVERSDEILEIPSGAARAYTLAFPAVTWNCSGPKPACARLGSFAGSLAVLQGRAFEAKLTLIFHQDGRRTLTCRSTTPDIAYLAKVGWTAITCSDASG